MGGDEFLTEVEDIKQLITDYEENLKKRNNIQNKLLKLSLTPGERESLSSELEHLGTENKVLRKSVAEKIRLGWSSNIADGNYERIKSQKMTLLTSELNRTIQESKVSEVQFKEKMREKLVETIRLTDPNLTDDDIRQQLEEADQYEGFCPGSMLPLTKEAKHQLDEIKGRNDQIRQMEDDILELTELFKEMKELVEDQGYKLDMVEDKIEDSRYRVQDGVVNLGKAKDYFNRAMEKKRLLATIGFAVGFILLIIIIYLILPESSPDTRVVVVTDTTTMPPIPRPTTVTTTTVTTTTSDPDLCDVTDPMCVG